MNARDFITEKADCLELQENWAGVSEGLHSTPAVQAGGSEETPGIGLVAVGS